MIYEKAIESLRISPKVWLITGVAGFIGSNLLEVLLRNNQRIVGVDNFSTGHKRNLAEVKSLVSEDQWRLFSFIEGDIRDLACCRMACSGVDYVLHQAALGSVPRSLDDPITSNSANIDGFLNMLVAARDSKVKSFTYAASSSTYGDHPGLPKTENIIGSPLSPYAVTKYVNELYASVFGRNYGFNVIGLRYFNVFGKRQDPEGAYSAVIPRWTRAMILDEDVIVNGDGETSRDFSYIDNIIQANVLSAIACDAAKNNVYNVAVGGRITLNDLFDALKAALITNGVYYNKNPIYKDFRYGDVRHSQADISKARKLLGYDPKYSMYDGVCEAMPWYIKFINSVN